MIGEPDAGESQVRFGGRGVRVTGLSYPYSPCRGREASVSKTHPKKLRPGGPAQECRGRAASGNRSTDSWNMHSGLRPIFRHIAAAGSNQPQPGHLVRPDF
jgi:hypothetical protein